MVKESSSCKTIMGFELTWMEGGNCCNMVRHGEAHAEAGFHLFSW